VAMQPQPDPTSPGQRALILAAAGVGLLGLVLFVVTSRSSGRPADAPSAALRGSAIGPATTAARPPAGGKLGAGPSGSAPSASLPPATSPPPIVAPATAKDPFHPLVGPPSGGDITALPGTAGGVAPPVGSSTPATVPGASTGTATTPGGGSTVGRKVTLVDVFRRSGVAYAHVEVDEQPYRVRKGQVFAGSYKAVDIGTSCAEFLTGGTAFTLCEGEAVLK